MKGMFNAQGQVLRLDLPDQRLGGVEHEGQWLVVAQQRLNGLQMQLDLKRQLKNTEWRHKQERQSGLKVLLRRKKGQEQRDSACLWVNVKVFFSCSLK